MNIRKICLGALLVAAPLLIAAPAANADTGSSSINLGCILQSLSGESPTADCDPPQIPAATP
ncbi:hypothetical protein [Nocardia mangyaensis]|uniref:hypothetical protein n=1 Tax=Nocardia mangyaensis TaxID=2213200 RepID=UPI0026775421|nr:hypothetical protein [Nocardia mangyaensis]MDO3650946.1 hypothetical protein [Nocardia mangyaensis]